LSFTKVVKVGHSDGHGALDLTFFMSEKSLSAWCRSVWTVTINRFGNLFCFFLQIFFARLEKNCTFVPV
jgi:hypothetical protein